MKPILFSTPMVQALLNTKSGAWPAEPIDGSKPYKSQTRRVIKLQPLTGDCFYRYDGNEKGFHILEKVYGPLGAGKFLCIGKAPYRVGDVLYVRETWQKGYKDSIPCNSGRDCCVPCFRRGDCTEMDSHPYEYLYKASPETYVPYEPDEGILWRPSIHMPREAARLFLEVKSARVERVREIKTKDTIAEGVGRICTSNKYDYQGLTNGQASFAELWDSLNAKRGYSWESNPWVWVYEFMRRENDSSLIAG